MSNLKNIINSFKIKNELDTKIWDKDGSNYSLKKNIREKLLQTAYEFYDSLGVDVIISDITFTGSLANFNWSDFSDIDLHLIADYNQFNEEELPLYKELFLLKKTIFNDKHDITILNYEVELYVQDENEEHTSTGVYSVLNDEWIVEPKKDSKVIDKKFITNKSKQWMDIIDGVLENISDEPLESAKLILKKYKDKIKKYRTCGLEKGGEYSIENLVFKVLRRNGYIEKLYDAANKLVDNKLSIREDEIKDPKIPESGLAKIVKPDVEEFYKTLDNINTNITQQQSGNYSYQKEVETVQIALDILGYPLPKYGVDGKFGPETARAVNNFKNDNSIKLNESIKKIFEDYEGASLADTYGFPEGNVNSGKVLRGGEGGNWGGSMERVLQILSFARDCKDSDKVVSSQKRTRVKTASGNVSDHYVGNLGAYAVDIPTSGKKGDELLACIMEKWNGGSHKDYKGGKWLNIKIDGYRYQFGWRVKGHYDHIHVGVKKIGSEVTFIDKIKGFFSKGDESGSAGSGEAVITPKMADKLIEKLKEKNLTPEQLEKYTSFKMDFSDVVTANDDDFYKNVLEGIGAPITPTNLKFFYAWRQAESGTAKFNPFNTTYKISNDTGMCYYNCLKDGKGYQEIDCKTCPKGTNPGVKSYSTSQYGLEATVSTLRSKKYACIVGFLRKGDVAPEKIANDCLSELETWGTGEGVAKVLGGKKIDPPPIEGIS